MSMDFFLLGGGSEAHPAYQSLAASNSVRQYHFLNSIILANITSGRPLFSQALIRALNFHAIVGLHHDAGDYRAQPVQVGAYVPPPHYYLEAFMDDFVNETNLVWQSTPSIELAAQVLWRVNAIHPFSNGNGRTARAACYFVLSAKSGRLLPGRTTLTERLVASTNRSRYLSALQAADAGDLAPLIQLIWEVVSEQVADQ